MFDGARGVSRCEPCRLAANRVRDQRRPNARQRGYTKTYEAQRAALRARSAKHVCCHRGEPIDLSLPATSPMGFTAHHVVPTSIGGTNDMSNLKPCHNRCNKSMGNRPQYE